MNAELSTVRLSPSGPSRRIAIMRTQVFDFAHQRRSCHSADLVYPSSFLISSLSRAASSNSRSAAASRIRFSRSAITAMTLPP